jgi:truncated hemoglobin YjbI
MVHMMAAVDELSPNDSVHQQLMEYMTMASTAMINSPSATI